MKQIILTFLSVLIGAVSIVQAQVQPRSNSAANAEAPANMIRFEGIARDLHGKPLNNVIGISFLLYKDEQGGTPLWMETQNVRPDSSGHYCVLLGASRPEGLPTDLFRSKQAQWLGVQIAGRDEQSRVMLVSVPYALKAGDADTLGGMPASAFLTSAPLNSVNSGTQPPGGITGSGTANFVPLFTGATTIANSKIFQTVGGNVGIATTAPTSKLDVKGTGDFRDTLTLFPKTTHPALSISGTAFQVSNTGAVTFASGQTFPGTGTITGVTAGAGLSGGGEKGNVTLTVRNAGVTNAMLQNSSVTITANSPLSGGGAVALGNSTSLGLKSCSNNQVLEFISGGWTCANAGSGTITGVSAGTDLTGGGTSGTVTLNLDTTKVPQLSANNTFNGDQQVKGNISVTGTTFGGIGNFGGGVLASTTNDVDFATGILGEQLGVSKATIGVEGYSSSLAGVGVYGNGYAPSSEGTSVVGASAFGVWGDTGLSGGFGLVSSADEGYGVGAFNASQYYPAAIFKNDEGVSSTSLILDTQSSGFGGECVIDVLGNLGCTGSKSAVVPVDSGSRKVALYAVESPENWFEDFGSGQLSDGSAVISLEPTFSQTVNTHVPYQVFLTPNGNSHGLYVVHKMATSFEVREQDGGTSSVAFDYRIVARRKGYENIRLADRTAQFHNPQAVLAKKGIPSLGTVR